MADKPVTREEKYLAYLTGDYTGEIPKPITRKEKYLYELCLKGIGGEISPEEIKNAVNEYLEKNPVKPGATTEQAQQIEQNKTDVASLKEDISNKITKFYASNQGETHITDSDNGKIQDMVLYGKSEQKQYKGINLLPPDTNLDEYIEVSISKGSFVFWITDGTPNNGGNFRFFNEDKTESMWFGITPGITSKKMSLTIDAKYVQNVIRTDFDLSKICLGVGSEPIYEPYTGGIPSPSPDYPQEIKNVVNPTVKVCGKNLWNPIAGGYINGSNGSITENRKENIAVTDFIKINGKDITVIARNFSSAIKDAFAYRVGLYNSEKKWIKNIPIIDGNRYSISAYKTTDSEYIRVSAPAGIYDTIQIEYGSEATPYEPYTEQSVQLPYTLNAIPVNSGGNVTIDGQQYVADYVDVERGKLVRMVGVTDQDTFTTSKWNTGSIAIYSQLSNVGIGNAIVTISSKFSVDWSAGDEIHHFTQQTGQTLIIVLPKTITTVEQGEEIRAKGFKFYFNNTNRNRPHHRRNHCI